MRIIGFSIKKISAERKKSLKDKFEIKQGLNIEDIAKEEINISEKPSLRFDFGFTIDYTPDLALVEVKGSIIALEEKDDSNETAKILKDWKKKKFDHPMKLALFNFILSKCNIKALQLEEEIGLPLHIPFPRIAQAPVQEQSDNKSAAGKDTKANYTG